MANFETCYLIPSLVSELPLVSLFPKDIGDMIVLTNQITNKTVIVCGPWIRNAKRKKYSTERVIPEVRQLSGCRFEICEVRKNLLWEWRSQLQECQMNFFEIFRLNSLSRLKIKNVQSDLDGTFQSYFQVNQIFSLYYAFPFGKYFFPLEKFKFGDEIMILNIAGFNRQILIEMHRKNTLQIWKQSSKYNSIDI